MKIRISIDEEYPVYRFKKAGPDDHDAVVGEVSSASSRKASTC